MNKLFKIELTMNELELLDGKVSEIAQKVIEEARKESSFGFDFPIVNEILKKSEQLGKLTWRYKSITNCTYCDKKRNYYTYPRSGRYHRKGDKNYDKPIYYSGIKFNEGTVTIQGYGDMCSDCCKENKVIEKLIDYILEHDLRIEIMKNDYKTSRYIKDDIRECYDCHKEMQESQMKKQRTMMGDGYYPSGCPHCGAESLLLGKNHKLTNKFAMIPNPSARPEIELLRNFVKNFNQIHEDKDDHINLQQLNVNPNVFVVKEDKWTNGHSDVIAVHTIKNIYEVGYFYEDKEVLNELVSNLKKSGLQQEKFR